MAILSPEYVMCFAVRRLPSFILCTWCLTSVVYVVAHVASMSTRAWKCSRMFFVLAMRTHILVHDLPARGHRPSKVTWDALGTVKHGMCLVTTEP